MMRFKAYVEIRSNSDCGVWNKTSPSPQMTSQLELPLDAMRSNRIYLANEARIQTGESISCVQTPPPLNLYYKHEHLPSSLHC